MSDPASDDELLLWAGSLMTAGSLSAPNNPKREGCLSWIFFFFFKFYFPVNPVLSSGN